jgi:protocatechuate 3,4-dioxygenase beta subunit
MMSTNQPADGASPFTTCLLIACGACLACAALAATSPVASAAQVDRLDRPAVIRGRVVDEQGIAVEEATVWGGAPAMGQLLWWAQSEAVRSRSRADGSFELSVPCGEVLYALVVERMGYSSPWVRVLPRAAGHDDPLRVEIRLKRGAHGRVHGRVRGPDGAPAAAAEVTLVGEYGFSAMTRTDAIGMYRLEVPEHIGQAVPVVQAGDLVAPQQIARAGAAGGGKGLDVQLGQPARFEGQVVDQATGGPLAGAAVTIRPWFSSGFEMRATCDDQGRYTIVGVPPGGYHVEASAPGHFDKPPRGQSSDRPRMEVAAGGTAQVDVAMSRSATVRGRVLGPGGEPVPGAVVGMPCTWSGDYRNRVRYVRADVEGNFEIHTGHIGEEGLRIAGFSARFGLAEAEVKPLAEGEVRGGLTLSLAGAVRVRGAVVDGGGKPVPGVTCVVGPYDVSIVTGADGGFDLGRVALPREVKQQPAVSFRTPRPSTVSWITWSDRGKVEPDAPTFYEDLSVQFDAAPDKDVDLKVVLKPTDLLVLDGRVTDAKGEPVPGAKLYVFAGNAKEETWADQAVPRPRGEGSKLLVANDKMLAGETADKDGRFRLRVVRFDGEATPTGTRFSVGVVMGDRGVKLVKDVTLAEGMRQRELAIQLD